MCGVFAASGEKKREAELCLAALTHRGPDGEGLLIEAGATLAHRRLSIIDVDVRSNQPMVSASGKTAITFNGEIYNYRALRDALTREGARFKTESDTEVLLEGYERYGAAYFERLRGMWALVIHDRERGELVAARDPFGIKPLYYAEQSGSVIFASELRCLKKACTLEPDPRGYYAFYNLGYFIGSDTPYKNMFKMLPGEVRAWGLKTCASRPVYRVTRLAHEPLLGAGRAGQGLEEALTDSVAAHYVADVPVSILLSGGTDSSLIAALSVKLGKRPTAYHVAISGSGDTRYAEAVARHLGLSLVRAELDQEALTAQYEKLLEYIDEPTADLSIIPTSLIFERIKGEAKVVLSGEGGDELFGGYLRHTLLARHAHVREKSVASSFFNALFGTSLRALTARNPAVGRLRGAFLKAGIGDDLIGAYLRGARLIDYPLYEREIRHTLASLYGAEHESFLPMLVLDTVAYLPNDLLPKSDTASMASSIEARVPFVDRWVASAARKAAGEAPPTGDKRILKEILARHLPHGLAYRGKSGFGVPMHVYETRAFARDFDAACAFHLRHPRALAVNQELAALIGLASSRAAILRKYPRFAFALVTNWKVHSR